MEILVKPNIFDYKSFNSYLNDWVSFKKKTSQFTLGMMVRDLELNSIAEIANILKDNRKVSHKILFKLKDYLRLSEEENFHLELIAELDRNEKNMFITSILTERLERTLTN